MRYENLKDDLDKMVSNDTFIDEFYYHEKKILFLVDYLPFEGLNESLCANYGVYVSNLRDESHCLYEALQVDQYDEY